MSLTIIDVDDERSETGAASLSLIENEFLPRDRHSLEELRLEIQEKRLGFLDPFDFHQLAAVDESQNVVAAGTGVYLPALNAGFIIYLVVTKAYRRRRLGREVRAELVKRFEQNARESGSGQLRWVMGEVKIDSPWLITLVKTGNIIPFDLEYFHPDLPLGGEHGRYVLYREIISDDRERIPVEEMRRILYTIYRRAYRESYPMAKPNFRAMIDQLQGRESVGPNQEVTGLAAAYRS